MEQLDLFGQRKEPELEPIEVNDFWRASIPDEMESEDFSPRRWLEGLVAAKEHMVFLFNRGKGMCQARCESRWEPRAKPFVDKAVLRIEDAETVLRRKKYIHHSNYHGLAGEKAKVFVRWWDRK